METATKLMTIADYEALGPDAPYELIRGVLYEVAATKKTHVGVASKFIKALVRYSESILPGEIVAAEGGFVLESNPDTLIVPDVAFIRAERWSTLTEDNDWIRIAPDAAIEVKSPSNSRKEISLKVAIYLEAGVRLVIVADADTETVTAHFPDGRTRIYRKGDMLNGEDALPGFSVPVAYIFS